MSAPRPVDVSVLRRPGTRYPAGGDGFSPGVAYPEYRHGGASARPNEVYALVRDTLAQAGLDRERFGTPEWNPLGELVPPGAKVFVLCNFVYHRRPDESGEAFFSKCTHGSVVRALVDYLLIAVGPAGRVRFGNAPVQSCEWERVLADTGADEVEAFYRARGLPVEARDLRMVVTHRDFLGRVTGVEERDAAAGTVAVDLAADSLLAGVSADGTLLRVSEYDPGRTVAFHAGGRHLYVLNREVLDADVVFSLPKLKTHEKVGITVGLKGSVGAVGHKDCLAHHRFGPPGAGGDEYPNDPTGLLRLQSRFHDHAYRTRPGGWGNVLRVVDRIFRRVQTRTVRIGPGSWWGNDTAWRMTLDIFRVLQHATPDGRMHDAPVRPHHLLVDGVVGGEGYGPLRPSPVAAGVVVFSREVAVGDAACARLMGYDPARIPLVRQAFAPMRYPVAAGGPEGARVVDGGRETTVDGLGTDRVFAPPHGWRGHLEARPERSAA